MTLLDRLFGRTRQVANPSPIISAADIEFAMPTNLTAKEFGKVIVRNAKDKVSVQFTVLMEPQGREAEGWQTGVAMDASASMKERFGRLLEGTIPPNVLADYVRRGWAEQRTVDGQKIHGFTTPEAINEAVKLGYLRYTANIVEPLARDVIAYLAGNLDADGGTTVIYWACGDGSAIEVLGDYTDDQCPQLSMTGPKMSEFGPRTVLRPAVQYFVDRFDDATRGMYLFITDGRIDDLDDVKKYTTQLARAIESGKKNSVKCVLIGVGDEIDEKQMEELDNLDTGTDVDVWDHKIAVEMRGLMDIFSEVVSENHIVAPTGFVYDSSGAVVRRFTDGLPAKVALEMPAGSQWFELEVAGRRIRQSVVLPTP